jgi:hypothetical protein
MFLRPMRREIVTVPIPAGVDWKALGYLISIVSVFFLGAVAWPKPSDPWWHVPALVAGMTASIIGMACRYKAHLNQQRDISQAKADARSS